MILYNNTILDIIQDLEEKTGLQFPESIKEEITNSFLCFEEEPELLFDFKLAYTKATIKINDRIPLKPIKCIHRNESGKSYDIEYLDGTKEKRQANLTVEFNNLTFEEIFNIFKEIKKNKR